jgi:cytochrome c-type biogenesis protein CcmE
MKPRHKRPSEIAEGKAPVGKTFRVGGMVEDGSIKREADGVTVRFASPTPPR